ncbi:MAG: hypothetical protein U9R29_00165 [Thermodesulfobacteriota bacterium]|nr:hypothetical protein [Thermodesulfobacteriota bacterium]
MHLLPRGKIIKEHLDTSRLKMPAALLKMCSNHFSGYLSFETEDSSGVVCYTQGKIVAVLWQQNDGRGCGKRLCGELALEMLFRIVQRNKCFMGIYRMADDFVPYAQHFCHASVELQGQLVDLVAVERLIARVQREDFSGCLRLYSADRVVLIFYTEGKAQGFYLDGKMGLVTNVDVKKSIVHDKHCLVDILHTDPVAEQNYLRAGINLEKTWLKIWRELNM